MDSILAARKSRHGDFKTQADISQALKRVIRGTRGIDFQRIETHERVVSSWNSLDTHQQEALEMIVHKIARVIAGDANYDDHWRDISGYSFRVEETLENTQPIG